VLAAGRRQLAEGYDDTVVTAPTPDRVAWLSGRSSPAHAALSPAETALLAAAERCGFEPVRGGFPYVPGPEWSPVPLVTASVRNGRQYLALRHDPETAALVAARLRPVFELTGERLLLVCGSLGLQLLLTALPAMADLPRPRLRVVALGPVAASVPPTLDLWVARGRLDGISALGYRGPVRWRPWCGHLGYRGEAVAGFVEAACRSPW
jgi:hypothetical protein